MLASVKCSAVQICRSPTSYYPASSEAVTHLCIESCAARQKLRRCITRCPDTSRSDMPCCTVQPYRQVETNSRHMLTPNWAEQYHRKRWLGAAISVLSYVSCACGVLRRRSNRQELRASLQRHCVFNGIDLLATLLRKKYGPKDNTCSTLSKYFVCIAQTLSFRTG